MINIEELDDKYSTITPEIKEITNICTQNSAIKDEYYKKYHVNRGLRDIKGNGVLTGLTEISGIYGFDIDEKTGEKIPCKGRLYYRGINIKDIVKGFVEESRFGFEEVNYLLLTGKMPNEKELEEFKKLLALYRTLPPSFVRDVIMKKPSKDMMNNLSRGVLTMHSYDKRPNDNSLPNVLRQGLLLTAVFPMLAVYGYQAARHYYMKESLYIHIPKPELSTAENILHMLRHDSQYTDLEARLLDLALVLHAEHGGGNNSTFTTRVVSSTGTDTYSAISAALGSLKGLKHGGANIKVVQMFDDLKENVTDWKDEEQIKKYLSNILKKKGFDKTGLIYGMGHAVYSISDPRAEIFKEFVKRLAVEKHKEDEFQLYQTVERIAGELIKEERKIYKGVSGNIDFYSGFVYRMLNLPIELYTPIFAMARISGWSAHRMEELINAGKIIRPAYMDICVEEEYVPLKNR